MAAVAIGDVSGFGSGAMGFLDGLVADNTKTYFDAHRSVYDTEIARLVTEVVVAVGERLAESVDPDIGYEPRIGAEPRVGGVWVRRRCWQR